MPEGLEGPFVSVVPSSNLALFFGPGFPLGFGPASPFNPLFVPDFAPLPFVVVSAGGAGIETSPAGGVDPTSDALSGDALEATGGVDVEEGDDALVLTSVSVAGSGVLVGEKRSSEVFGSLRTRSLLFLEDLLDRPVVEEVPLAVMPGDSMVLVESKERCC